MPLLGGTLGRIEDLPDLDEQKMNEGRRASGNTDGAKKKKVVVAGVCVCACTCQKGPPLSGHVASQYV